MSRTWLGIGMVIFAGACVAQSPGPVYTPVTESGLTNPDMRNKRADPSAVEIPLYAGAAVRDVLDALNEKGFTIKYDKEQVLPTMKLLERPKATRIDRLLSEILAPWSLKADRNQMEGGWRVRPTKKKKEVIVEDPSPVPASGASSQ